MGNKCLELLRVGGETPGSRSPRPGPWIAIKKFCPSECDACVRLGLAGATSWQEGHVQAPGTAFCLLEELVLNKFVYGHSQQFLNPTFHLMFCVRCCALAVICLFSFHLIPEGI